MLGSPSIIGAPYRLVIPSVLYLTVLRALPTAVGSILSAPLPISPFAIIPIPSKPRLAIEYPGPPITSNI